MFTPVEEKSYIELQSGGGYFSKFDYKSDPYENYLDSLRRDKERAEVGFYFSNQVKSRPDGIVS